MNKEQVNAVLDAELQKADVTYERFKRYVNAGECNMMIDAVQSVIYAIAMRELIAYINNHIDFEELVRQLTIELLECTELTHSTNVGYDLYKQSKLSALGRLLSKFREIGD